MTQENDFGRGLPPGSRHYRAFVGPPEKFDLVAANQFTLLIHLGLREHHLLLDVGCGSLRTGRLLIPYLLPACYYGIEPDRWLVEEGIRNEIGNDLLKIKRPVFSHNAAFDCSQFEREFDFILIHSIFSHASRLQIMKCLSETHKCLAAAGILAATFMQGADNYEGDRWVYPDCVTYRLERIEQMAAQTGLVTHRVDWPHPNGQTWVLMTRPGKVIEWSFLPRGEPAGSKRRWPGSLWSRGR